MEIENEPLIWPFLGLCLGTTLGMMGQTIPFTFVVVTWIAFIFALFNGISYLSFTILGMTQGVTIAAFANILPFGFVILSWQAYFLVTMVRSSNEFLSKPVRIMFMPLILIIIGGLLFAVYPAFQVDQGHGLGGGWMGCNTITGFQVGSVFTGSTVCIPSTFGILPSSIFAPLAAGNYVGFFASLFLSPQSAIPIISLAVGILLLLLSLGIGGSLSLAASGFSWAINDAATRMAQSLGIAFLLYGAVSFLFGGWYGIIAPDWGLGTVLQVTLTVVFFYGSYLQGRSIQ